MARRNYKIAAHLELTKHTTTLVTVELDTGAGSSIIKHSLMSHELQKHARPLESQLSVRDASSRLVSIAGSIILSVNVESQSAIAKCNVAERLRTEVILGCEFFDAQVEAKRPRKRVFKLTDGTTIPIL